MLWDFIYQKEKEKESQLWQQQLPTNAVASGQKRRHKLQPLRTQTRFYPKFSSNTRHRSGVYLPLFLLPICFSIH
jgi:hypothetical protein